MNGQKERIELIVGGQYLHYSGKKAAARFERLATAPCPIGQLATPAD